MDPPEAYKPPKDESIPVEELHPYLQGLVADHDKIKKELVDFEASLLSIKETGITRELNDSLGKFFQFFNEEFLGHDKREERELFPALSKKLVEKGEHSQGAIPTTAVDVMEEDHLKIIQLVAVIFNFFALASRLQDNASRCLVLDAAIEQSNEFIELLRLHIFREDTIIFPLAHKYIAAAELDKLQS